MSKRDAAAWRKLLEASRTAKVTPARRKLAIEEMRRLRSRAISTVERGATEAMRDDYQAGVKQAVKRASAVATLRSEVSPRDAKAVVAVARSLAAGMVDDIGSALSKQIERVKREAQLTTAGFIGRMHPDAPALAELAQGERAKLDEESIAKLGDGLGDAVASQFLATLEPGGLHMAQALDALQDSFGAVWYQVERFVRTEGAFAFNATCRESVEALADEIPGLAMRWTEYIDDAGTRLDDRVADDSVLMHGQICPAGGVFTFPDPDSAPAGLALLGTSTMTGLLGKSWRHPPNRPNDRATIAPWLPEYGVPGWSLVNGRRVALISD
jgi:hypothetical protein